MTIHPMELFQGSIKLVYVLPGYLEKVSKKLSQTDDNVAYSLKPWALRAKRGGVSLWEIFNRKK